MQAIVILALVAAASATTIYRVPSADSAHIESHRVGGNFAYSTSEGQAYGVVNPVVQHVATPVATSYSTYPVNTVGYSSVGLNTYPVSYGYYGNVATVRTGAVQNVVVPSTSYIAQGTPANTVKTVPTYTNLGYSVVV